MKKRIKSNNIIFFSLVLSFQLNIGFINFSYSQVEFSPNFFSTEKNENNFLSPTKKPSLLGEDFLKSKPLDITDPDTKYDSPNLKMDLDDDYINPGDYYLSRLKSGENKKNPNSYNKNQFLGDFRNNGEFVEIIFRDHEYPDGDRVQILVNDNIIVSNVLLEENFKGLKFKLNSGFNKIDFLALNQGESGPNTAEVRVFDDNNTIITSNKWNLATGVRATLIVIKK
tara:strand:- start:138 stop:815 length:678 start_codon:yes stop_codon:yes gene_type:complete